MNKLYEVNSVVDKLPEARGEFLRVEWEQGHPCAVIKNSLAIGTPIKSKVSSKTADIADRKIGVEETVWFALDTKQIVQYYRDITIEGKSSAGFGTSSGASGGPSAGPSAAGAPGGAGGSRGGGKQNPSDFKHTPPTGIKQKGGGQAGGGRPAGVGGPQGGRPGSQGPSAGGFAGGPGPGAGSGMESQATFVRVRYQMIFTLEK